MSTADTSQQLQAITAFAHDFVVAAQNRLLHGPKSCFVLESLGELVAALQRCVSLGVEMPLQLQVDDRVLHYDGEPLDGPSLQAAFLLRRCTERSIAMISFRPGLGIDEANRCFDLLLLDGNRDALRRDHRDLAMQAYGIRNIAFTLCTPGDPSNRRSSCARDTAPLHQYQDLAESLQTNHALAFRDLELAIDEAAGVVERALTQIDEPSTLLALATQDDVDRFTIGHSVRVALLALQVARHLGLDRDQLVSIGTAALMHDIGKSKVPQEILWKRGKLSDEEWHLIQQHPRLGAELLLEQHSSIDPCTIGAAFCHHMAPDGRGYPRAALPFAPSGTSLLIRVCDVFEALTAVRPYKHALLPIEAFAVMFRNEHDFDPDWLRCFARTIGLFPTGSRIKLDDGSDAIVIAQGKDPGRPVVRLLTGSAGVPLAADEPDRMVIGQQFAGKTRRIVTVNIHERAVQVPDFDEVAPVMSMPHACLSTELIADANAASRMMK